MCFKICSPVNVFAPLVMINFSDNFGVRVLVRGPEIHHVLDIDTDCVGGSRKDRFSKIGDLLGSSKQGRNGAAVKSCNIPLRVGI